MRTCVRMQFTHAYCTVRVSQCWNAVYSIVGIPCNWKPCTLQINKVHRAIAKVRPIRLSGPCHLLPVLCTGVTSPKTCTALYTDCRYSTVRTVHA